jgi:hypothetical protein
MRPRERRETGETALPPALYFLINSFSPSVALLDGGERCRSKLEVRNSRRLGEGVGVFLTCRFARNRLGAVMISPNTVLQTNSCAAGAR